MWTRADLKIKGKAAFMRNYWPCVIASIVFGAATALVSYRVKDHEQFQELPYMVAAGLSVVILLLILFVGIPLIVGSCRFFLANRFGEAALSNILIAYQSNLGNIVFVMFMKYLQNTLWYMLLIVPGIIKTYEYRMIPYILADNPDISKTEAFAKSREMMMGEKMNLFVLDISFIGWNILSGITFGLVGIFYGNPYIQATYAEFYSVVQTKA